MDTAFATLVARGLSTERFSLLDAGCAGGIDPRWRAFEPRLRAIAVDASRAECERLRSIERNSEIEYVAAFVSRSANGKVDLVTGQASPLILRIRERLSFMRTREIREARLTKATVEEKLRHNAWEMTELADPAAPVVLPDLLAARGWTDLDYLKIDIDGADFEVLQSFEGKFDQLGVLGVQLEVNFIGTDAGDEHTFHNTDRFMRRQGFELFRLDVRTYSSRALPARYIWPTPAETVFGRPFQGEAHYARDIDAPGLDAAKLAKLAAIFSAWGVPDMAAELLIARRTTFAPMFDVDKGLDLLAAQAQPDRSHKLGYRAYLKSFEADRPSFYRPEGNYTLAERLAAAWQAFRRPRR
ncbi:MAG: FkbM family methyltransferase [Reyranellales bacterium]